MKTKLRSMLSMILSLAMVSAMLASPASAADETIFTMDGSTCAEWKGRGVGGLTIKALSDWTSDKDGDTVADADTAPTVEYVSDEAYVNVTFPAGHKTSEAVMPSTELSKGEKIYTTTELVKYDFDVKIPSNATMNDRFMAFTFGTSYEKIGLYLRNDRTDGKTGIYAATRKANDGWSFTYTPVLEVENTAELFDKWIDLNFTVDITNANLILNDGTIVTLKNTTHSDLCVNAGTEIDYFGLYTKNSGTDAIVYGIKDFTITDLERTLSAEVTEDLTASSNKLNFTFSEAVSQKALDNAAVTILDADGAEVSGASAVLTTTGDTTAQMTIAGLTGSTVYTTRISGLYTASGRTGTIEHTFATGKAYADTVLVNGNTASGWRNAKNNGATSSEVNGAYATDNTETGGVDANVKAGVNSKWEWSNNSALTPTDKRNIKFNGKTLLVDFDVEIPNDETFALASTYFVLATTDGSQNENATICVAARNNNGKYELYVRLYYNSGANDYYTIAEADTFAELAGWHNVKFAVDTQKLRMAVYAEDGTVISSRNLGNGHNDLKFSENTYIAYMAIMLNNSADTTNAKKVSYKNFYVKTLERGLEADFTADMTATSNVVNAVFADAVSADALANASYTVLDADGNTVSGAVVTPTLVDSKNAKLVIEGLAGSTNYTLSIDNIFANSGRTSDGALSTSFTTSKVYADSTVLDGSNGIIWTNSYEKVQDNNCDIYATNTENGEIVVHVKAGTTPGWVSGKVLVVGGKRKVAIQSKTTLFDFDLEIPDDETFALANQYLTLSIKGTGQNENGNIVVGLRKNNDKYQLYLRLYVDAGNYEYYTIAEADTFDGIKGWHDVKFAIDTKKYMLAVYNENGTVAYRKNLDKINNDLKLSDSSVLNYAAIFPKNSADTEKTIKYRNLVVKGLDRAFTADASTVAKSTQFSTTVTFDTPVNTADIEKFVTVARKDGAEHAVSPVIAVTPVSETEAVITVSKLSTNTAYTLTLDGLFNNDLRTSNGALVSADVTTTKSDTVCIEGTPTVTKDASGFSAAVTYKNVSSVEQTFWTAVALYKSNGEIVALEYMDISLGAGESVSKNFAETVDCSGAVQAEVFVWDSIDTMNALQKHESISLD